MSAQTLEEVLAETALAHIRGDWSDRTYNCQGCAQRVEDEVEAAWPTMSHAERVEHHNRCAEVRKPDWTLAEYAAHLGAEQARAVRAWMGEDARVAVGE